MALIPLYDKWGQYDTERGTMYVRWYTVPKGSYETDKPALGALMPDGAGASSYTAQGIITQPSTSGLLGPRCVKVTRHPKKPSALDQVEILYEALTAYVAPISSTTSATSPTEIKGSRRDWIEGNKRYAERLYVSDDNDSGISRGDVYTPDGTSTPLYSRVAFRIENNPSPMEATGTTAALAGRIFHRVTYGNFIANSDTTNGQIMGSGQTWNEGRRKFAEKLCVTTSGGATISENAAYGSDAGSETRYALEPQITPEIFPGRDFHRILYIGHRDY